MIRKFIGSYMPPYRDAKGNIVTGSVSALEKIMLEGVEQWYTIRGRSKNLPLLLFLHGGPGSPQTGAQRKYNDSLEEHYLVVNWDQRGSGKSFSSKASAESMTLTQLISDANFINLQYFLSTHLTFKGKTPFMKGFGETYGMK